MINKIARAVSLYLVLILSTQSFADHVDCQAAEKVYQDQLNGLKRVCTKKSDCRADNLRWDPCAKPIIHSDSEIGSQLNSLLADLSKLCPRPARPCAVQITKPICLDGLCEDSADLGSMNDKIITIQFKQKSMPLSGAKVDLDADTGKRCAVAPCDSSMVLKTFTTDQDGKIYMTVGDILSELNGSANPDVIHRYVGPDGYSLIINNVGYQAIDLSSLLVNTQKVTIINFQ